MKKWMRAFFLLFYPPCCTVCQGPLRESEVCICFKCNLHLPRTNYHLRKNNPIEEIFWGRIPIVRASSFFFYSRKSRYTHILHQLKYKGQKELGHDMGRIMANEIKDSNFFDSIDTIIPVPLHVLKEKKRSYNQSAWIAKGVSEITNIVLDTTSVTKIKHTSSQTDKSRSARIENVHGVFSLSNPEKFIDKHVLIIDDVLTTGATMEACASVFYKTPGVKISILTLAAAQ